MTSLSLLLDPTVTTEAGPWLIKNAGIFGVVILALAGTVVGLALELRRVYREQKQDAKDNAKEMLNLNDKVHQALERIERMLSSR